MFQAQVLGSSLGQGWSLSLLLSFIPLGAGTAWQAISQRGKARIQVNIFYCGSTLSMRLPSLSRLPLSTEVCDTSSAKQTAVISSIA